jgi:Icc protein
MSKVVRLVQVSDCHLMASEDARLMGVDTRASFNAVMNLQVISSHPDAFLLTGDLSQDGSTESYQYLNQFMAHRDSDVIIMPGNHDNKSTMMASCPRYALADCVTHYAGWTLIIMDSQVKGQPYGHLNQDQLQWLSQQLGENRDRWVLLSTHHHVLPINCGWLDRIRLQTHQQIMDLVLQFPNLKAVVSGHVHHASVQQHSSVAWITAPSTCFQFDVTCARTRANCMPPGVQEIALHDDGKVVVTDHRAVEHAIKPDAEQKGY